MAYRLLSFGVRAGLAGGFIYWTREEGLWGNAHESTQLYQKLYSQTSGLLKEVPVQIPDVPRPTELCTFVRVNWNKAIYGLFNGIEAAPHKICEWSCAGWSSMKKLLDQPSPPATQ